MKSKIHIDGGQTQNKIDSAVFRWLKWPWKLCGENVSAKYSWRPRNILK